ncbi:MAG: ATP-binding protein [Elusimicrobiaceae bacterium]|nr:ATP-binding protein [Elusimicrobiaceae bacterium]
MNKLLLRQIKDFFGVRENIPEHLLPFVEQVSEAYDDFDRDRALMDRVLDISSQEMAEQNKILEHAKEALSHVSDNLIKVLWAMPFGVVVISEKKHKILSANNMAIRLFGYEKAEDVVGKECHKFICPSERGACPITDLRQNVDGSERMLVRKNGGLAPILKSVTKLVVDGEPVLVEAFIDISERKKMEQFLKEAKDSAESANNAKSAFLSNVSHEIRTPLHAIIGFAENIIQISTQEEVRTRARIILNESESFLRLINDILDQSKLDSGKFELSCTPFSLSGLVHELAEVFKPLVGKKQLRLGVNVELDVPDFVLGDSYRVQQILTNLVGNAVKYTESGFVEISVGLAKPGEAECEIMFKVSDSGIGIAKEKLERIFDPFYQVSPDLNRKYEGSGLGTSIAKKLVEQMNGVIGCDSAPGQGSVFWFKLPLKIAGDLKKETASAGVTARQDVIYPAKKTQELKILFAEDRVVGRDLARVQFEQLGLKKVTFVNDGREALDACVTGRFDLVFLDLQMPVMDGIEAASKIRATQPAYAEVPLLAITANVNADVHKRCLDAGFNEVLLKPVKTNMIAAVLYKYFGIIAEVAAAPGGKPGLVSYSEGLALFGGNKMLFESALGKFREEALRLIPEMADLLEAGSLESLGATAHKLAGSAASVSCERIAVLSRRLEDLARKKERGWAGQVLAELQNSYNEIRAWRRAGDN